MPNYNYKVKNTFGEVITGSLDFNNEAEVVSELKSKNYFIIEISRPSALNVNLGSGKSTNLFSKITIREIGVFTRQFAILINSGMSLIESLTVLIEQTTNIKLKAVLIDVRVNIESGLSLSEALTKHKKVFPRLYLSMVSAGEMGGILDKTLNELATFLEKENEIHLKIKNKTAYPKFVLAFAFVIILAMVLFIVPTFQDVYEGLGAELPLITRMVIGVSSLLKSPWFYVAAIGLFFLGRFLIKRALSTDKGKFFFDSMRIKIPKFGDLIKKIALARFARTLGVLIASGVPILKCLEVVKGVSNNIIIDKAVDEVRDGISKGENISLPLSKYKIFTPMFIQMVNVGERSGTLDTILGKVADFYDQEIESSIEILMTVLEPLMLLVVALMVGVVVIAMYLPMFKIYQFIN